MYKVIIEDADLNETIHYKRGEDVDVFIERKLGGSLDPDSLIITVEVMTKDQIYALKHLHETDWYSCRLIDNETLIPTPIKDSRETARGIL